MVQLFLQVENSVQVVLLVIEGGGGELGGEGFIELRVRDYLKLKRLPENLGTDRHLSGLESSLLQS